MTQSARWYMDVAGQILAGVGARTNDALVQYVEENELSERLDLNLVQIAWGFRPEPVTPETFIKRTPYANPDGFVSLMDGAVERGWLVVLGEGRYSVSARGTEVAEGLFELGDQIFGALETAPDGDMERIIGLLFTVVETARQLPEPAEKWALSWGSKFDRGPDAPLMVRARRHMLDLLSYRDDVHIAAWQPYGVSGKEWEAFTMVWQGDATNATELAEKLPYRRYDEDAYEEALQNLVARGWIMKADGAYAATEKGKKLRQEAEDATDRYFDAAWASLSETEMEEIQGLLGKLAEMLKPPEEEPAQ
jgi:DNA-binding MarR family transcriptional regulator